MKKIGCGLLLVTMLTGCAGYRPIIDTRGLDSSHYEADLHDCQTYAEQISPAGSAVAVAIAGAVFGALLGAAVGGHQLVGYGAGIGAVEGGATGAAGGAGAQKNIIRNCMAQRGYRVLY